MKEFNISINNVVRHFDASCKNCPRSMSANSWTSWTWFKEQLIEKVTEEKQENNIQEGIAFCTAKSLNIRDGAGVKCSASGLLNLNKHVAIIDKNGEWRKVRYYNASKGTMTIGWVNANYLRIDKDVSLLSDVKYGTVVVKDYLNIRADRGTQFTSIGKLYNGDKVKILYLKDKWYSIDVPLSISPTGVGFIHSNYIKMD